MYILGISAFYHDSAACLIYKDEIIAAAQEERFTRKKHDNTFPVNAIKYCINEAGINASDVMNIVFYEKPFVKFERLIETYLAVAPKGFVSFTKAMQVWIKDKLFQKSKIIKNLKASLGQDINWRDRLLFSEHHLSHAASAFYPSSFESAAIFTLDGVGEWTTTSLALGKGNNIKVIKEIHFPHSLGLLYSAFTYYLGFKVNSGEYKIMGLAPYGKPKYADLIFEKLIKVSPDGSFQLDMKYFDYLSGLKMTSKEFDKLFGGPPRKSESKLTQKEMDLAASIQKVTEEIVIKLAKNIAKDTGERNLCLAGGVALNCVVNGILLREKIFENIWVQPASGDAGGALGAALSIWYLEKKNKRRISSGLDSMKGTYLGPQFTDEEIIKSLNDCGAKFEILNEELIIKKTAEVLSKGKSVGWFQNRMEFGPRALGSRSILADPRSEKMQKELNLKIKFRESFRPFAPSVLRENVSEWFDLDNDSPYMLFVSNVKKDHRTKLNEEDKKLFGIDKLNVNRSKISAVTHVDYSARIQTVHRETNPLFHSLISKFYNITSCPMLVNTSFNVRGEPIVCSPIDSFKCFMGTGLDILVIGNCFLEKKDQMEDLKENYTQKYELD